MSGFTSLRDLLPESTFESDIEEEEEEQEEKPEENSKLEIPEIPVEEELPEFPTDEDILLDHLNPTPPATVSFEFDSSGLSSTETEMSEEDLDDVLAELARQLTLHGGPKLIPLPSNRR